MKLRICAHPLSPSNPTPGPKSQRHSYWALRGVDFIIVCNYLFPFPHKRTSTHIQMIFSTMLYFSAWGGGMGWDGQARSCDLLWPMKQKWEFCTPVGAEASNAVVCVLQLSCSVFLCQEDLSQIRAVSWAWMLQWRYVEQEGACCQQLERVAWPRKEALWL